MNAAARRNKQPRLGKIAERRRAAARTVTGRAKTLRSSVRESLKMAGKAHLVPSIRDFLTPARRQLTPGDRCDLCGAPNWGERPNHCDHDHDTGEIRGMLCHACNVSTPSSMRVWAQKTLYLIGWHKIGDETEPP